MKKKTTNKIEILILTIIFILAVIYGMKKENDCNKELERLEQLRQDETVIIKIK